jgi:hypothetical protein
LLDLLDGLRQRSDAEIYRLGVRSTELAIVSFRQRRWLPLVDSAELVAALAGKEPLVAEPVANGSEFDWPNAKPLSAFLLQVVERYSGERLVPSIDPARPMRLVRWLDVPADSAYRALVPLAATMTRRGMNLDQLKKQSIATPQRLIAWLNACAICGCLAYDDGQTAQSAESQPVRAAGEALEPSGFLFRLRRRLGLA